MLDSPVQITDAIMVIFNVTGRPERRASGHPSGELPTLLHWFRWEDLLTVRGTALWLGSWTVETQKKSCADCIHHYHLIACLMPLPPCPPHSDGADLELGTRTNTFTLKLLC